MICHTRNSESIIIPEDEVVEEVYIQAGLNNAADVHDPVVLVEGLVVRSVHPIEDVEGAVEAEQEHVMARQVLHFSVALQRDQLRHDREGFQVNGEHPKHLQESSQEIIMDDDCKVHNIIMKI